MRRESIALILPFAAWMVLMAILPSAPWSYAVRTVVTLAVLIWSASILIPQRSTTNNQQPTPNTQQPTTNYQLPILWGVAGGLLVLFLWVWPEKTFAWYRHYCMYGYTANAPVDVSAWYWKAFRIFGSAFVISVAEELFFRKWLMRYAGFVWMVALFAVEHNRWLVAAITGAIYGWLALRKGLASAIIAHVVTNLALGIYVLVTGDWGFW